MHLTDVSLVEYPSQNLSEATLAGGGGGGEERFAERCIEFIIQTRRKGGKSCCIAQLPFRESEFFLYVCLSFPFSSPFPPPPSFSVAGKWHYLYSICFFTHTYTHLDNSPNRKRGEIFRSANAMNTDKDRSKCVSRIGSMSRLLFLRRENYAGDIDRRDSHCSFIASYRNGENSIEMIRDFDLWKTDPLQIFLFICTKLF